MLREKAFWLLLLCGVIYFFRPLFLDETFFFRDLNQHDLPEKQILVEFLRAGKLPVWDPLQNGGRPFLANVMFSPLYPFNLAYLVFPLLTAFNLMIVGHCLACLACAYAFARIIGFRPESSFIAGAIYGMCGYTLSLTNMLNRILAMPYLPLLCLLWHLWLTERKRRWFLLAALAGACQALTGAPETCALTMLFVLAWSLVGPCSGWPRVRRTVSWGLLLLSVLGVTALQIVPMLEIVSQSARGEGLEYAAFSTWSFPPKRIPELVLPNFLGFPELRTSPTFYWGINLVDKEFPFIISVYVGGVTLLLAGSSVFRSRNESGSETLPHRTRIVLGSIFGVALLLSFGRYLPFFRWMYQHVPLITLFRFPIKFLVVGMLPLALLSADGAEQSFGGPERRPSIALLGLWWGGLAAFGGLTAGVAWSEPLAHNLLASLFGQPHNPVARYVLTQSLMHLCLFWGSATVLFQYRRMTRYGWQYALLAGLICLDLFIAARHVTFYAPKDLFTFTPQVVPRIRQEIGAGRLFRPEHPEEAISLLIARQDLVPISEKLQAVVSEHKAPPVSAVWKTLWDFEVLNWYLAVYYDIPTIYHKDIPTLSPARILKLTTLLQTLPWQQRLPFLSAGAVTLVYSTDVIELPELPKIAEFFTRSDPPFSLYRNLAAAAPAEFITAWRTVAEDANTLQAMMTPGFDPRREAIIHPPEPFLLEPMPPDHAPPSGIERRCASDAHVETRVSTADSAEFSVTTPCAGYLVLSEIFYPGWHAFVDGRRVPLRRANLIFSAIYLEPGTHTIRREYRPNSLWIGLAVSLLSGALLALWGIWPGRHGGQIAAEQPSQASDSGHKP